ncbi:mechanosensitive ion channel [Nisaea acidiphila]|uniref:Mechanosensitive ion channel n=1 Tax=Nisaea acidiphila TaxID=1862145 RepID=A0A9J7AVJ7_9PROT|nr:mechanosensitive ion channel family protein [Nisaea acidiphila]UUX49437.1 mechanosensitive ion channel [Nisaea acidiphila]
MKALTGLRRLLLGLAICAYAMIFASGASMSQMPVTAQTAEPDPLQKLVSEMTPEQKDALTRLIETLDAHEKTGASVETGPSMVARMQTVLSGFRLYVSEKIAGLPDLLSSIGSGLAQAEGELLKLLGFLLLSIAAAVAAEQLFIRVAAPWRDRIRVPSGGALGEIIGKLGLRAVLELGGVVVFLVVALLIANAVPSNKEHVVSVSSFVLLAVGLARIAAAILRFVLAPNRPDLRLVAASDDTVRTLYRFLVFVFGAGGFLMFLSDFVVRAGQDVGEDMRFWTSLLATLWLIGTLWHTRAGLTRILIGDADEPTPGLARMARWWPPVMILLLTANWLFLQTAISAGVEVISPLRGTLVIVLILITPFLDTMVRGIASYLVPSEAVSGGTEFADESERPVPEIERQTRLSYIRIGRTLLFGAIVILVGKLWGLSLQGIASVGIGAELAAHMLGALLILACGYLVWEFCNLWINRRLIGEGVTGDAAAPAHGGGEGGGAGQSRLATVLPLVRVVLSAVIAVLTVLLALDSLGINITPLLAGAGVIGLAVGFGAQTLVKDVVSGVFFLLDDAFRVGEFIDAGGTLGAVEKISVRSILLRSVNGPIHIIPYGEIAKVTNMSRDWVIMKLRFTVPFDTDLDKVRKIFKKIGQEMMEVPELAEGIIEPFKSQGAADVDDVGIIVRGKFMTKPGHQFAVRKEVYSRVQRAFRENGIDFARKEVRVNIPGLGDHADLTPEQENAIAAAASQAAEPPAAEPQARKAPADDR